MGLFFFYCYHRLMAKDILTDVERELHFRYVKPGTTLPGLPSTAFNPQDPVKAEIMLPDNQRGRMPFTKEKFLVKESEELVMWERETRKFLRKLSPQHGHRVSAAMVYEWATGVKVKDLVEAGGSTVDLKRINKVLRFYFGKSYMTYICGHKVPNAFKIPPGWYIRKHRPMTLTLYAEWCEGVLYP